VARTFPPLEVIPVPRANLILASLAPLAVALGLGACGGSSLTVRRVDTIVGHTDAYGAPHNLRYEARAEAERELIRLTVTERSECTRLRMKVIQRVEEKVDGDEVVSRSPAQQLQVPDGSYGVVPCHERFARDVWVSLRIGRETYRIGQPSPKGEVIANLAGELRQGVFADAVPEEATVVVDGKDAGTVSLASYATHEARMDAVLADFRALVEKDAAALTGPDLTRAYELYSRLRRLDTAGDPRFQGLSARFLELVYQRKVDQADERLKRNLKALGEAKGLLAALSAGAVPPYVALAVQSGAASPEALLWARGEVALALRGSPALCSASPFTWNRVTAAVTTDTARLAFSYLRFAEGDPFQAEVRSLCGRL
jgi:hypothetical protein